MHLTGQTFSNSLLRTKARALWLGAIGVALAIIATLDHATSSLPVQHFYYIPIILAALRFRKMGGLLVVCASVLLYQFVNPRSFLWQHAERDILQLLIFIAVGLVTARLVEDAERRRLLALTDDLTRLHNLRSFEAHYARLLQTARTKQTPLILIILDLDHLKDLNARFGHLVGAQAIQTLGRFIAEQLPEKAVACRYGGDEFVLALPNYALSLALDWVEGLRRTLEQGSPTLAGHVLPPGTLTLSAGVADFTPRSDHADLSIGEILFQAADKALY